MSLGSFLLSFLTAIEFLTILPVRIPRGKTERSLVSSMLFFPLVGILIGILSLILLSGLKPWLPSRLCSLLLVLFPILLSGGLHVDGFADFCDGFFGGKDKAGVLRIMKDPRIGAWGAVGVIFLMLAKLELLEVLPNRSIFFLMAMTCSRWAQVALSFYLPYAGSRGGLGEIVAGQVRFREFFGATLFLFPLLYWIRIPGIFVFGGLVIFLILLGLFFHQKIGGLTGDLLGAASELSELCVYVLATVLVRY